MNASIVKILGNKGQPIGTGFLIDSEGHIMTCSHVLLPSELQKSEHVLRPSSVNCSFYVDLETTFEAKVLQKYWYDSDEGDIAIIQCQKPLPPEVKPVTFITPSIFKSSPFETIGFPLVKPSGLIGSGTFSGMIKGNHQMEELQLEAKALVKGFSGAPIFVHHPNDKNQSFVVGMLKTSLRQEGSTDRSFGIPSPFIAEKTNQEEELIKVLDAIHEIDAKDTVSDEKLSLLKENVSSLQDSVASELKQVTQHIEKQEGKLSKKISSDVSKTINALSQNNSCVLFLGPEIALRKESDTQSLHEEKFLQISKETIYGHFNQKEGLFDPPERGNLMGELYQFYDTSFKEENVIGNEVLYNLAHLPLKLIISFTPDDTIHRIMRNYKKDHEFLSYEAGTRMQDVTPTVEKPLIINAFGTIAGDEGTRNHYICTYKTFYQYITNAQFPTLAKKEIKYADQLLFIGFNFQKWQSRLLLFMLEMHKKAEDIETTPEKWLIGPNPLQKEIESFLEKQFQVTHVHHNYRDFTNELVHHARAKISKTNSDFKYDFLTVLLKGVQVLESNCKQPLSEDELQALEQEYEDFKREYDAIFN